MSIEWANPTFLQYVQLYQANMYQTAESPDMSNMVAAFAPLLAAVNSVSSASLERRAKHDKDPNAMIELGLRHYTGCAASKSQSKAERYWNDVVDLAPPPTSRTSTNNSCRAVANSCLAHMIFEEFQHSARETVLGRAGIHGEAAALFGLRSPTVLMVARAFHQYDLHTKDPFDIAFPSLWKAYDDRMKEMADEDEKRNRKVRKKPNNYACAWEGCGLQATSQAALRKCGGPCLPEDKPSYCSVECQKADWPSHKPDCKPSKNSSSTAKRSNAPTRPGQRVIEMFEDHIPPKGKVREQAAPGVNQRSQELRMQMPGPDGPIEVRSSTMTPAFMKQVQEETLKEAGKRGWAPE